MTETLERSVNQMCSLSYGIRLEGGAMAYCEMFFNGVITPDVAALALNQSEDAFKPGMQKYHANQN